MDKGLRRKTPALLFAVIMSFMMLFGSVAPALAAGEVPGTADQPEGLTGSTLENGNVRLRWLIEEDPNVLGYFVYRSENPDSGFRAISLVYGRENNEFIDKYASVGIEYYYKINTLLLVNGSMQEGKSEKAVDIIAGEEEMISQASPMAFAPMALPAPPGTTDVKGNGPYECIVTWNRVAGAEGYLIKRSTDMNGAYVDVTYVAEPSSDIATNPKISYTDDDNGNKLTPDTEYWYDIATVHEGAYSWAGPQSGRTSPLGGQIDAPLNFKVKELTPDGLGFVLTWDSVLDAESYNLYRKEENGSFEKVRDDIGPGEYKGYIDSNLKPDTEYTYYVTSNYKGNESVPSNEDKGKTLSITLDAPIITASLEPSDPTGTTVSVDWPAVPRATEYDVYRADSENGTYDLIGSTGGALTYKDPGRVVGNTYWYMVKAKNSTEISEFSNKAQQYIGTPPVPTPLNLTANLVPNTKNILVKWNAVSVAERYDVYRSTDGVNFSFYKPVTAPTVQLLDENLTGGVTYYYYVKAVRGLDQSDASNVDSDYVPLDAPMNLVADAVSSSAIKVKWDAVDNASKYKLYRSLTQNGTYTAVPGGIVDAPTTEYLDMGLDASTTYWYYAVALDANGVEGKQSNKDDARTFSNMSVKVTPYTYCCNKYFGLMVTWTPVSGATSYSVYRSTYDGNYKYIANTRYNTYDDMCLPPNTTYWYKIVANTGDEAIGYGTTLGKPFSFKVCCDHHYGRELGNTLRWHKQAGITHFSIYRSLNNRDYEFVTQVPGTTEKYVDKPVSPKTDYYYRLVASNGQVEQAYTKTCGQSLSLSVKSKVGTMELTWKQISNANSYAIYRSTDGKTYRQIDLVSGLNTTYVDTQISFVYKQKYYYKVVASNYIEDIDYATAR